MQSGYDDVYLLAARGLCKLAVKEHTVVIMAVALASVELLDLQGAPMIGALP